MRENGIQVHRVHTQGTGKQMHAQIDTQRQMKLSNHIFVSHIFLPLSVCVYVMHGMCLCLSPCTLIFAWKQNPNFLTSLSCANIIIGKYTIVLLLLYSHSHSLTFIFPGSPRFSTDEPLSLLPNEWSRRTDNRLSDAGTRMRTQEAGSSVNRRECEQET